MSDPDFGDLVTQLRAVGGETSERAIAALADVIAARNEEFSRAEEWREKFEELSGDIEKQTSLKAAEKYKKDNAKFKKMQAKIWKLEGELTPLRSKHATLLQTLANKDAMFEFHIKQLAEANTQWQRQLESAERDLLDAYLEARLNAEGIE